MEWLEPQIRFCFPVVTRKVGSREEFVATLITSMQNNGSIEYAGYMEDGDLERVLLEKIGSYSYDRYKKLSREEREEIIATISSTLIKCNRILEHPEPPIYVFVFPWFPDSAQSKELRGIDAVAPHANVIHVYIDLSKYTATSLKETVAHEYNHLVFYHYQPAKNYTLLQHLIIEGLAENFREEVVGGKPAPWSVALSETSACKWLQKIEFDLNSRDERLVQELLLGGGSYQRWMGYSIGYHLVRNFRNRNPGLSWSDLERQKAETIAGLSE